MVIGDTGIIGIQHVETQHKRVFVVVEDHVHQEGACIAEVLKVVLIRETLHLSTVQVS